MEKLIIGGQAMKHWFPKDYPREPSDTDIVLKSTKGFTNMDKVEYFENPVILEAQSYGFLRPELMLTLKISHMFWDFRWRKHMYDIQFLVDKGIKHDETLLNELIDYWLKTKPKVKRSNLGLTAKDFFTNAINADENEHDYLHTLINPVPMYTRLLKDGAEVELDVNKWYNLSFEEKCDTVFEETAVMGYERYKEKYYKEAYEIQLEQNIQKHFPRYIAVFAILNYKKVVTPKFNFIKTIENELQKN